MTPPETTVDDLRTLTIVLVEPARGGNIGAAARAMKTMGFESLRVVDSKGTAPIESDEARAFAHASTEILDGAERFLSLQDAVADCGTVVATTGRRRGKRSDLYTPEELLHILARGPQTERIALVFGPEERGLSNDELDRCDITSAIPMRAAYPSLNLGQAVMVYTYQFSSLRFRVLPKTEHQPEPGSIHALQERARTVLPRLGFDPGRAIFTRMLERLAVLSETDANLLHSLLNAVDKKLPGS